MEFSTYSFANVEYLISQIAAGKTVQFKFRELTEWTDYVPDTYEGSFSLANASSWYGYKWRVKPKTKKIKYRVFLCRDNFGRCYPVMQQDTDPPYINIVKVLEDWKEIEYEVE